MGKKSKRRNGNKSKRTEHTCAAAQGHDVLATNDGDNGRHVNSPPTLPQEPQHHELLVADGLATNDGDNGRHVNSPPTLPQEPQHHELVADGLATNDSDNGPHVNSPPTLPQEPQHHVPVEDNFDAMFNIIFHMHPFLEKTLARGVEERLNSKEALCHHFLDIYCTCFTTLRLLFFALVNGLAEGAPRINEISVRLDPGEDPVPLLILVCQWKFLAAVGGWKGKDELVDMVLKAGADVNCCFKDMNALSFAVTYGNLRTVDLLLEAGIHVEHQNDSGMTCLHNALVHPSPPIISRLLEYLPANEIFVSHDLNGQLISLTAPDRVMYLLITDEESWRILGTPEASDVSEVLMMLHQNGACFSNSCWPLRILGNLFASDAEEQLEIPLKCISMFKEVAKSLVGATIPKFFIPHEESSDHDDGVKSFERLLNIGNGNGNDHKNEENTCPICLQTAIKEVTLYCGHSFCRECIIDHGQGDNGDTCPVCRRQICLELRQSATSPVHPKNTFMRAVKQIIGTKNGPLFMTDEQVKAECKFQKIDSNGLSSRDLRLKLIEGYETGHIKALKKHVFSSVDGSFTSEVVATADLAIGFNVTNGHRCSISPKDGPVCIGVTIGKVPLLARISNHSVYTILSKTVVDNLGLTRMDSLTSNQFVDTLTGKRYKNQTSYTCLEPFCLKIGEVEVTLHTAIEASPDPFSVMFGMQLGLDFLHSGVWCPIDVAANEGNRWMRVDGEMAWQVGNHGKEMLRYYSRDGQVATVPLLHFSPFDHKTVPRGISLKENVKFEECYWCCRIFPKGMKVCATCFNAGKIVTYCDEKCQRLAYRIHKKTCREKK